MVLKYEDYIKEGFINKTLKRVRTGGSRVENQTRFTKWLQSAKYEQIYMGDKIWLSVPFGELNGDKIASGEYLTPEEVREIYDLLPEGYRIATNKDFNDLFKICHDVKKVFYKTRGIHVIRFNNHGNILEIPVSGFELYGEIHKDVLYPQYHYIDEKSNDTRYCTISASDRYVDVRGVPLNDPHGLPIRIIKDLK